MKKIIALVLAIACILTISACNQKENEDILHLGINAEIVEIDTVNTSGTVEHADRTRCAR